MITKSSVDSLDDSASTDVSEMFGQTKATRAAFFSLRSRCWVFQILISSGTFRSDSVGNDVS